MTGFWKRTCTEAFGLSIKPFDASRYSVSFCGPGGCFEPGQWTPNTAIAGDPDYELINENTLGVKGRRFFKCSDETNPQLTYGTAKGVAPPEVHYASIYNGLPDYDKDSPFDFTDNDAGRALNRNFSGLTGADLAPFTKQCDAGSIVVWKATEASGKDWIKHLTSNICSAEKLAEIRRSVARIAPKLVVNNITAWAIPLEGEKDLELLVGYVEISKDESKYPYLSIWRLRFVNGSWKTSYIGPFLDGDVQTVGRFGQNLSGFTVFVRHASCMECEPVIYLTAFDYDEHDEASPVEFSYDRAHKEFGPTVEYELPGMGHTVDAKVETRLLEPSDAGPHLLQFFKMKEGPDEWWVFTCKRHKCDYELYQGQAPKWLKEIWVTAKPA